MSELTENNRKKLDPEIVIDKYEIANLLDGINRCNDRLKELIELRAPMVIIRKEVAMIQYRALSVLSCYEAFALLEFIYKNAEETEVEAPAALEESKE